MEIINKEKFSVAMFKKLHVYTQKGKVIAYWSDRTNLIINKAYELEDEIIKFSKMKNYAVITDPLFSDQYLQLLIYFRLEDASK